MQSVLIALKLQNVIRFLLDNFAGNFLLAAHRVDRNHRAVEVHKLPGAMPALFAGM